MSLFDGAGYNDDPFGICRGNKTLKLFAECNIAVDIPGGSRRTETDCLHGTAGERGIADIPEIVIQGYGGQARTVGECTVFHCGNGGCDMYFRQGSIACESTGFHFGYCFPADLPGNVYYRICAVVAVNLQVVFVCIRHCEQRGICFLLPYTVQGIGHVL